MASNSVCVLSCDNLKYVRETVDNEQLIHKLTRSHRGRLEFFKQIEVNNQGAILLRLSNHIRKDILEKLDNREIIDLLNYLDPDKATNTLRSLDKHRSEIIISNLSKNIQEKVEFLLRFNPKTAAGLMSLDYIEVDKDVIFDDLTKNLLEHEKRTGKFPTILVTENHLLIGELPGHTLVLYQGKDPITPHVKKVPKIHYNSDERKVIDSFVKHPHNKVVVLNDDESILGVIHSDEALRFIEKRSTADLYGFAGVRNEEDILDSAFTKVRYRYRWLILNLGTAFLAASVVGLFADTISRLTLLAVYMPVVAGMGGNAGTQTLVVTIRGLVLKEVALKNSARVVINEMIAGAINGTIIGVLVSAVATFFNKSPLLGLVLGIAMVVNLVIAGLFGAIVPLIMKALGKDPASSATVFITTATDVFGFLVFLGLAKLIL